MSNKDNTQQEIEFKNDEAILEIEEDVEEVVEDLTGGDSAACEDEAIPLVGRMPNILFLDIETSRITCGVWRLGKQSIGPEQVINDFIILGWAAKWLGQKEIMSSFVTSPEAKARNDRRVVAGMWELLNAADIVVTHNGDEFDIPKLTSKFMEGGLDPVAPFATVDTCKALRKTAGFTSNKLDYVSKMLLGQQKTKTGYDLWIGCENGNIVSLAKMEQYCQHDVELLEGLYLYIRPYIKNHPNVGTILNSPIPVCPVCGSPEIFEEPAGVYTTQQNAYAMYRCSNCGTIHRQRKTLISASARAVMTVPVAH